MSFLWWVNYLFTLLNCSCAEVPCARKEFWELKWSCDPYLAWPIPSRKVSWITRMTKILLFRVIISFWFHSFYYFFFFLFICLNILFIIIISVSYICCPINIIATFKRFFIFKAGTLIFFGGLCSLIGNNFCVIMLSDDIILWRADSWALEEALSSSIFVAPKKGLSTIHSTHSSD